MKAKDDLAIREAMETPLSIADILLVGSHAEAKGASGLDNAAVILRAADPNRGL